MLSFSEFNISVVETYVTAFKLQITMVKITLGLSIVADYSECNICYSSQYCRLQVHNILYDFQNYGLWSCIHGYAERGTLGLFA